MNRFIQLEPLFFGGPSCSLERPSRAAATILLVVCCGLVSRDAAANVINGNFQTGDLTGWEVNTLIPALSNPGTADVTTVGGSLVGEVRFSSSTGGRYAGSLSQDFFTGGANKLMLDIGFSATSRVTPGEPNVVDTMTVLVENLDTNTTIAHPFTISNDPGEPTGAGVDGHTNGLSIHSIVTLPNLDTHVRVALFFDFQTLPGISSSGRVMVDNVRLVPEPSSWVMAVSAPLALVSISLLRRGKSIRALLAKARFS